jgi:hypothetical protein
MDAFALALAAELLSDKRTLSRNKNFHTFDHAQGRAALALAKTIREVGRRAQACAEVKVEMRGHSMILTLCSPHLKAVQTVIFESNTIPLLLNSTTWPQQHAMVIRAALQSVVSLEPQALGSRPLP